MSKDLGKSTSYAYYVAEGGTKTPQEYGEMLVNIDTVATRAEDAADSAAESATGALNSQNAAQTAATTATNKASEATTAAQTATTKAGEASQSASQASASAQTASTKASEASQSASTASAKATEATTAAGTATTAKNDAVAAKTAAETAQGKAEDAQEAAEDAAESVSASVAQIATNTADISDIKEGLNSIQSATRNINTAEVGRYRNNNNQIEYVPSTTTVFGMSDMVECEADADYTSTAYDLGLSGCSMYFNWYDSEKAHIREDTAYISGAITATRTSPSNAKYVHIFLYQSGAGIPDIANGKIQIEKGTVSTTYISPYSANDKVARQEMEELNASLTGEMQKISGEQNTGIEYLYGVFQNGGMANGVLYPNQKYRVSTNTLMTYDRTIKLTIASGYKIGVHIFINGTFNRDSGWITNGSYTIPAGTQFKCVITTNPEDTSVVANVETYVHAVTFPTFTQEQINGLNSDKSLATSMVYDKSFGKRYVCHLGNPYYDGMIIPSQSRFDIERARKAGFTAIELNVQATSDGKYIVGHGNGGKFGTEFYHIGGTDISDTAINSVTLSYIKTYVRTKSAVDKYKVAPLTLEEALLCCKNNGIMPAIATNIANVLTIANKIVGADNYIGLVYAGDRPSGFNGACASWLTLTDKDEILAKCQASGGAYSAGLNVTNSAYASFTLSDWKEIAELLHENGYRVNSAYVLDPNLQHTLEKAGFDYVFSAYQIPEIENGNVCNLSDNNTFADFNHNGTVTDGKLVLATGQTVEPTETYPATLSSGGSLHVSFIGTIKVSLGKYINIAYSFTCNDDTEDWWFSTYFNGTEPTFKITASADTTISELSYKASRF